MTKELTPRRIQEIYSTINDIYYSPPVAGLASDEEDLVMVNTKDYIEMGDELECTSVNDEDYSLPPVSFQMLYEHIIELLRTRPNDKSERLLNFLLQQSDLLEKIEPKDYSYLIMAASRADMWWANQTPKSLLQLLRIAKTAHTLDDISPKDLEIFEKQILKAAPKLIVNLHDITDEQRQEYLDLFKELSIRPKEFNSLEQRLLVELFKRYNSINNQITKDKLGLCSLYENTLEWHLAKYPRYIAHIDSEQSQISPITSQIDLYNLMKNKPDICDDIVRDSLQQNIQSSFLELFDHLDCATDEYIRELKLLLDKLYDTNIFSFEHSLLRTALVKIYTDYSSSPQVIKDLKLHKYKCSFAANAAKASMFFSYARDKSSEYLAYAYEEGSKICTEKYQKLRYGTD